VELGANQRHLGLPVGIGARPVRFRCCAAGHVETSYSGQEGTGTIFHWMKRGGCSWLHVVAHREWGLSELDTERGKLIIHSKKDRIRSLDVGLRPRIHV
jgi:hypothetical protein